MVGPNYLDIWMSSSQSSKDHIDYILVSSGHRLILFTGLLSTEILKYNVNLVYRPQKQLGHEHECKMTHKCAARVCVRTCTEESPLLPHMHTWD